MCSSFVDVQINREVLAYMKRPLTRFVRFGFALLSLFFFAGDVFAQDYSSNLVGHWTFDETSGTVAADSAGSNNGTMAGGLTGANSISGVVGNALQFDGVDDEISVGYVPGNTGTISMWFKSDGTLDSSTPDAPILEASGGTGRNTVFRKDWARSGIGGARCNGNDGSIDFVITPASNRYSNACTSTTSWTADQWYHLVATWDGSNQLMYVNGVLESTHSQSRTGGWGNLKVQLSFGSHGGAADDLRAYDRVLSAEDVAALYDYSISDCSSPSGMVGEINFNQVDRIYQYCNGSAWIGVGKKDENSSSVSTANLIAHWGLDESSGSQANDSSVNSYTGTLSGGLSFVNNSVAGVVGRALDFDGVDDKVSISSFTGLTAPMSFSAWIKPDLSATTSKLSYAVRGDNTNFYIKWDSNFGPEATLGFFSTTGSNVNVSIGDVTPGQWHYIAGTFDGTTLRAYNNGVEVDASPNSLVPRSTATPKANIGENFEGSIDDVRVYTRVLTPAEIQTMYDDLAPTCQAPNSGLVAYWKMDETTGTTAVDETGNNDAAMQGAMAANTATGAGAVDTALFFNNNQMTVPHHASHNDLSTGYTIAGWFYFDSTQTGTIFPSIVSKNNNSGGWGDSLVFGRTSAGGNIVGGRVRLNVTHGRSTGSPNASYTGWSYEVDQWVHVILTWDGSTVTWYKNGVAISTTAVTTPPDTSTGDLRIGSGRYNWSNDNFQGGLDDLRIYNRVLSSNEISALYGAAGGLCSQSNCANPMGAQAELVFNTSHNTMQYCNGENWIAMGPSGDGGSGCISPVGLQGELIYNSFYNVLQYCEGDEWVAAGRGDIPSVPSTGLAAHWTFDETSGIVLADSSGNGRDTAVRTIDPTSVDEDVSATTVAGKISNAQRLNGGDDRIYVKNDTHFIAGASEASMCLWLNLQASSIIQDYSIMGKYKVGSSDGGFWFWVDEVANYSGRTNTISFAPNLSDTYKTMRVEGGASNLVSLNQWDHYCATFSGGNFIRVYKNGILSNENSSTVPPTMGTDTTLPFKIGNENSNIRGFDGMFDDVRIYERALSSSEVLQLYDATR